MRRRTRSALVLLLALLGCAPRVLQPVDQELLQAATVGDAARVDAALAQGATPNADGPKGWTPLMLAARSGNVAAVSALLQRGADANARNSLGETALMVCTASIVQPLVNAGADVNAQSVGNDAQGYGPTALMLTSDVEKTRALLDSGANVNARSSFGATPLMYAVLRNEGERARMLIEAGADVGVARIDRRTALMLAADQSDAFTIGLLLKAGGDVNARDVIGRTALHLAAINLHQDTVQAVLTAHPDVNAQDNDGNTPLLLAARDGATRNARALLAAGADPQIRNGAGQTAMQWATAKNNAEMMALLRDTGADETGTRVGIEELKRTANAQRDGALQVFTTSLMTDGRTAKIRGRVKNVSTQRVEGIQFEVSLIEAGSSRVLDTLRDEVDTTLDPQQEAPLRLDVQSMYFGSEPHFLVRAIPMKLTNVQ